MSGIAFNDNYRSIIFRESEERSTQLKKLLDGNIKLKQKWKDTFNETTEELRKELVQLHEENTRLMAENRSLCRELLKCNRS